MTDNEPRRSNGGLTEDEIELLVQRVSKRVMNAFYEDVGRNVLSKALMWGGILVVSVITWLAATGKIKAGL